jgi:hypothetical protein
MRYKVRARSEESTSYEGKLKIVALVIPQFYSTLLRAISHYVASSGADLPRVD